MGDRVRLSRPRIKVLQALDAEPNQWHYGYGMAKKLGFESASSMYEVLDWLEERGWVVAQLEDMQTAVGRPPRKYYRLTPEGASAIAAILDELFAGRLAPRGAV